MIYQIRETLCGDGGSSLEFREARLLYSGAFSVTSWDWRVCTAIGKPIQSLFGRVYLSTQESSKVSELSLLGGS